MTTKLTRGVAFSFVIAFAFAGSAHADITVAVAGPLTGLYRALGDQVKAGADQWAADINKAGGLLGQKVVVEAKDDGCNAEQAVTVADQLATEKVAVVIGHVCSAASIAASKVYAEKHIVEISPASTNPKFTDERPGPGVMRVCGRDDRQGMTAGEFLAWRFKDSDIAIVDDKSAYGKGLADETRKVMNKAGKKEVLNDEYDDGGQDYSSLVGKLKTAKVDVLYLGGYHPEAAIILKEMRAQGMKTVLVSGDSMLNAAFWNAAGDAAQGTLVTFPPDPRRIPDAKSVVAEFHAGVSIPRATPSTPMVSCRPGRRRAKASNRSTSTRSSPRSRRAPSAPFSATSTSMTRGREPAELRRLPMEGWRI